MTQYTIDIGSNINIEYISQNCTKDNEQPPTEFSVVLRASHGYTITKGDIVNIKRDGGTAFSGIVETIVTTMSPDGSIETISGRHKKVLIWRKWAERYTEFQGFWSNYYPNKVIEFLLRPSQSEYDETNYYSRIGYGLEPTRWVCTCYPATNYYDVVKSKTYEPQNIILRYSTSGYRSNRNQTAGDYLQIDLGSSKSIVGVRIENRNGAPPFIYEYINNYKVEISTDASNWVQVAEKTNNRALNIVESWAPTNARYIKITITANANKYWSVSGVFVYEATTQITGITQGTITEHLPPNVSLLTANVSAGATTATVTESYLFNQDDDIVLGDDNGEESIRIQSITDSTLTFVTPVVGNYTTANNAFALNYDSFPEIDLEYARRLDDIYKIAEYCTTGSVQWKLEVTDAGVVNFGPRTGTDKSATISFVKGTNIRDDSSNTDYRNEISRIYVVGKGKGDQQDQTGSGWIGTGEYEHIEIDSSIQSKEAAIGLAKSLLEKYSVGNNVHVVNVRDTYTIGTWGIDDDITITDPISGFSGKYRVVKVIRGYTTKGESVIIECTGTISRTANVLPNIINKLRDGNNQSSRGRDDVLKLDNNYIYKVEAEGMKIDPDTTIYFDAAASNKHYIGMPSTASGDVAESGVIYLKAGTYKVIWYSEVNNNSSATTIVTLDVYASSVDGGIALTTLSVAPNDYGSTEFEGLQSSFILESNTYITLRAYGFVSGIANWFLDFAGIQTSSEYILDYPAGAPAAPTGLTVTNGALGVTLKWTANTEADLEHYNLYWYTSNTPASATFIGMLTGTAFYFQLASGYLGTLLYYWITAVDRAGNESAKSTVATGTAANLTVEVAPGSIDSDLLAIEERKWDSDINFTHNNTNSFNNYLWWGKAGDEGFGHTDATITWADGSISYIIANELEGGNVLPDGIFWFYWDEAHKTTIGNINYYDLQHTSIPGSIDKYSEAVGVGKGIVAVVLLQAGGSPPGNPSVVPNNAYFPSLGVGILNAYTIFSEHITASQWIEGKLIKTTGAGVGGVAGVALSDTGLLVYGGSSASPKIKFIDAAGNGGGTIIGGTSQLQIYSYADQISIEANGDAMQLNKGGDITFSSNFDALRPASAGNVDLGTATYYWGNTYTRGLYITPFDGLISEILASDYQNRFIITRDGTGTRSYIYTSVLNDANDWEWVQLAIST